MNHAPSEDQMPGCTHKGVHFWVYATNRGARGNAHRIEWAYSVRLGSCRRMRPHGFGTRGEAIIDAEARIDRWRERRRKGLTG